MLGSNLSAAWSSEAARRGLARDPACSWIEAIRTLDHRLLPLCSFGPQSDKSQGVWGTESPKHIVRIHPLATRVYLPA